MTVSFKQFNSFLSQAEGQPPEKLDEIWSSIMAKRKEDADKKKDDFFNRVKNAHDKYNKRGGKDEDDETPEEKKKREREEAKKKDETWQKSKNELTRVASYSQRRTTSDRRKDDLAWHRSFNEGKQTYSDQGYWKDDAQEAGYKVKKLSGNLTDGDQTWGAFDGDKKMGEYTEKEDGRGGWLITENLQEAAKLSAEDRKKKDFDYAKVNVGAMKLDDFHKKWKLGKYAVAEPGSPLHHARLMSKSRG